MHRTLNSTSNSEKKGGRVVLSSHQMQSSNSFSIGKYQKFHFTFLHPLVDLAIQEKLPQKAVVNHLIDTIHS